MRRICFSFTFLSFVSAGCFTPDSDLGETDGTGETGDEPSTSSTPPTGSAGPTSSSAGTSTSTDPTMDTETSDATGDPTGDDASTETTGDPPEPFCGDGTVDADEECDDGDDNGADQACLPDCTLNVCGDGMQGPDEACDDGAGNALEIGACAPDCSRVIETRRIVPSNTYVLDGDLGNNPVAAADATCDVGYLAMFAVPNVREATDAAYALGESIDWVLEPYTAYVNEDDALIWITDDAPLLGVRDGSPEALLTPIWNTFTLYAITGLNEDWTAATQDTCNGWSNDTASATASRGLFSSTTAFLTGNDTTCTGWVTVVGGPPNSTALYCVEQ